MSHMTDNIAVLVSAVAVASVACVTDLRSRRIPNSLTLGAAFAGLLFHLISDGFNGLWFAGAGWLTGMALFLPLFLLRGMGGGDVKLVAALGVWLGAVSVFWVVMYASIAGAVIGVAVALRHQYLRTAFENIKTLLVSWALIGPRPVPELTIESSTAPKLAYALPILVGTVASIWLQ